MVFILYTLWHLKMDLNLYPTSRIYPSKTNISERWIELPVLFKRIATGPSGLMDVIVRSVKIGDEHPPVVRQPSIFSFNRNEDPDTGTVSLRGAQIGERPLHFRADQEGDNMLVFAFLIGLDEGQWNTLPEVTSVQITLSLIFSTFVSLDLVVNADLARSTGVLAFDKLHRKEKAHMVIANLAILSLVTGLTVPVRPDGCHCAKRENRGRTPSGRSTTLYLQLQSQRRSGHGHRQPTRRTNRRATSAF